MNSYLRQMRAAQKAKRRNYAKRLVRLAEVVERTGLSRSGVYDRIKKGSFPPSVALGEGRARRWVDSEIDTWIAEQIAASRGANA